MTLVQNANKREMKDAIYDFSEKLNKDTVGLFYYAGHAVQYHGENYLIPINALSSIKELRHLEDEAVRSGIVSREMTVSESQLNFIFLDACRDNPLPADSRGIEQGLARSQDAEGTLIAYSTSPGSTAEDGTGRNSPYTKNLLKQIYTPNQPIELMLKDVKDAVSNDTNGNQLPWYESSITGNFCFKTTNDSCAEAVVTIIDNPYLDGIYDLEIIDLENGDRYVGQVKDGKFSGRGVLTHKTGSKYQGEFLNGKKHGKGKTTQLNGNSFEGNFFNGKRHGKGELSWINGAKITTKWNKGERIYLKEPSYVSLDGDVKIQGYGSMKDTNDDEHTGYFEEGMLNGQGEQIEGTGLIRKGIFKNGNLNGQGSVTQHDGAYYETQFINGKAEGNGFAVFSEGSRYEGEFTSGEITGQGVYTLFDGTVYKGGFDGARSHGSVEIFYAEGSHFVGEARYGELINGSYTWANGDHYEGDLKNLLKHGYGKLTTVGGIMIDGEWKNNIPNGIVTIFMDGITYEGNINTLGLEFIGPTKITYPSGDRYEGEFTGDDFNGKGTLYLANGSIYSGNFVDGRYNGYGEFKNINGQRYVGEFKNNNYHGYGTLFNSSGASLEGNFVNNNAKGKMIYTSINGEITNEYY